MLVDLVICTDPCPEESGHGSVQIITNPDTGGPTTYRSGTQDSRKVMLDSDAEKDKYQVMSR